MIRVHDYFYGIQADQFSFIRVPTVLFSDEQYKQLSPEAKILYAILLSRMELSAKNGWIDDQGRVYIICTLSEIMEKLNCADNKATKLMNELESKCCLIERKRQGLGKPNLIYVKNFISSGITPTESRFLNRENHDSGDAEIAILDSSESRPSKIDNTYNNHSYTENPIYPGSDADGRNEYDRYRSYFAEALDMELLHEQYPSEEETLDGILDLLAEVFCSGKAELRVAGDSMSVNAIKSRLMKLTFVHVGYVLDCLKANTTSIRDMKQYLLTALFNAPVTISPYYQNRLNHDQYGGHTIRRSYGHRRNAFEDYSYTSDESL